MIYAEYRQRTGLFPEHAGRGVLGVEMTARATIPAVEALRAAGATVEPIDGGGYEIRLGDRMPDGLVAVHLSTPLGDGSPQLGLRLRIEPEYPGEHPDHWYQAAVTPCPMCGAPLIWYEAGYVPGYRVCARPPHHHVLIREE